MLHLHIGNLNRLTKSFCRRFSGHQLHIPVLSNEIKAAFSPSSSSQSSPYLPQVLVDGTFGYGGHSLMLLESIPSLHTIFGIDRDLTALKRASNRIQEQYPHLHVKVFSEDHLHEPLDLESPKTRNVWLFHTRFANVKHVMNCIGFNTTDLLLLDVGVSSMQLDEANRGMNQLHPLIHCTLVLQVSIMSLARLFVFTGWTFR